MLQTVSLTTNCTGLTVHAELDSREYPAGIRISNAAIAALQITRHRTTPSTPRITHRVRTFPGNTGG
ncbi:hypothetical protein ITX44_19860 [Streptomyces sp. KK5PA1]|uniref:Uncharacterized protein n=1 Tax=Actinacidiphila acididurans TaxID=2784346 RepID=A0ABS2TTV4_9ACTN|nr:hypothetical protein [Actinacidiphila acididurans]